MNIGARIFGQNSGVTARQDGIMNIGERIFDQISVVTTIQDVTMKTGLFFCISLLGFIRSLLKQSGSRNSGVTAKQCGIMNIGARIFGQISDVITIQDVTMKTGLFFCVSLLDLIRYFLKQSESQNFGVTTRQGGIMNIGARISDQISVVTTLQDVTMKTGARISVV